MDFPELRPLQGLNIINFDEVSLCKNCTRMFQDEALNESNDFQINKLYHSTISEIYSAAIDGCVICQGVAVTTPFGATLQNKRLQEATTYSLRELSDDSFDLQIYGPYGPHNSFQYTGIRVKQIPGHTRICTLTSLSRRQQSTGHPAVLNLGKAWLSDCLQHHTQCRKTISPEKYPTRLLHFSGHTVRLVSTAEQRPDGPYATVSHVWGSIPFFRLTKGTMAYLRQGVSINVFPQSFRDTMVRILMGRNLEYS